MKKSVLALVVMSAIASVAGAAEGSIEIYTILDDSVAHIEHSLPTSDVHTFGFNSYNVPAQDQGTRWAVVSGAEQMSRYGVQGNETFSNGMSGFFKLEGAMNTASGQIANNGRSVLNNANDLSTISSASSINGHFLACPIRRHLVPAVRIHPSGTNCGVLHRTNLRIRSSACLGSLFSDWLLRHHRRRPRHYGEWAVRQQYPVRQQDWRR